MGSGAGWLSWLVFGKDEFSSEMFWIFAEPARHGQAFFKSFCIMISIGDKVWIMNIENKKTTKASSVLSMLDLLPMM